jgi:NAD(P) transhydrogenase subunit beta
MTATSVLSYAIDLVAVLLLALGLKGLSKVRSARSANGLAALAMGLAVVGLLIQQQLSPQAWLWIAAGSAIGGLAGLLTAQRVPMTAMPETVALFNGCGGMASLLVAVAVALFQSGGAAAPDGALEGAADLVSLISIVISVFVGAITFSGSVVAMGKLQGWIATPAWTQSSLRHAVNITLAVTSGHWRHPADRRRRHAGGDLVAQQLLGCGGGRGGLRGGQPAADRRRGHGRRCGSDPHPGDVHRHEPLVGECAVRRCPGR